MVVKIKTKPKPHMTKIQPKPGAPGVHRPYPSAPHRGPKPLPPRPGAVSTQGPVGVGGPKYKAPKKVVAKPIAAKQRPYNWMLKDQQRLSNKYGITTYNTDGTVATVPQVKPEKKWWSEDIVEGEY